MKTNSTNIAGNYTKGHHRYCKSNDIELTQGGSTDLGGNGVAWQSLGIRNMTASLCLPCPEL